MQSDDIVARLRAHAKIPCSSDQWKLDSARANCPNTDIVVRLRALIALASRNNGKSAHLFKALDEIERLRSQVEHHARDRVEYANAWSKWIDENDRLEIAEWCRAYADAVPHPNPDGPEIVRTIHSRLDARHRMAAAEIERLRDHVRALEIEIERYRIQCVRISDLERMLEVQDTQLEHAQRALRILEGNKHEQQG